MRRRSQANHRRLAGFRRAPPPRGRSGGGARLGNLAAPPRARRRGELLGSRSSSSTTLCCYLVSLPPISSSPRCKASSPSLLHLPPFLSFRLRAAAPLSLSWSGRRLAASLPSGSLSRRPPRLHPLFVAAHARIGRSRSARGAIPHPTAPEPRRHRGAPRRPRIRARGPTRPAPPRPAIKISAPPFFLPPQAWGRHRHVAVVRGREKSKRPPAVAGGWGKGTGPRKAGANSPFTRLITSQFIY
jgi:hypothetical protein